VAIVVRVLQRRQKAVVAMEAEAAGLSAQQRRWLYELVYGVLRHYFSLQTDYSRFTKAKPDALAQAALLVGCYQLRRMQLPDYAALSATVEAVKALQPAAAGFVNAVLRRVAEQAPPAKLKPYQRAELPQWIYAAWRDDFGADAVQQLAQVCQSPPPLTLAVFVDRERWMADVRRMGIRAAAGALSPLAVLLPSGCDVTTLPGFDDGAFCVIDQAAQAAVMAYAPSKPPSLLLDLCAAPGGKTALLAHRFPQAEIVAVERQASRMARLAENLDRLDCRNVTIMQADATTLPFADASVDGLFLDAPCSASGILRRHPDAKFLHSSEDVAQLAGVQRAMVDEALRLLKPGAAMLYAVCSIHRQENENVVAGRAAPEQMQRLLPAAEHDGFFYAQLQRAGDGMVEGGNGGG